MLELRSINCDRGGIPVLRDFNLQVADQEIVALLGPNGSGKSTVLRTIGGLTPIRDGVIMLDDTRIDSVPTHERVARGWIGMLKQNDQIFRSASVRENLSLACYTLDARAADLQIEKVFDNLPVLRSRANVPAGGLSGGERQMLALACVLVRQPKLLLVDELSAGLAPRAVEECYAILRSFAALDEISMLIAEQNVRAAVGIADRAVIIAMGNVHGEVACSGEGRVDDVATMLMDVANIDKAKRYRGP